MIKTYIEINADADSPKEIAEAVKLANRFGGEWAVAIIDNVVTFARSGSAPAKTYETWMTEDADPYAV